MSNFVVCPGGKFSHYVPGGNVEWDATHYCQPEQLTPEEAAMFSVFPLKKSDPPQVDPMTHYTREADPVLVDGEWAQGWEIVALTAEQVAMKREEARKALLRSIVAATQERLDGFARSRNYDGILSACTYAASTVPKFHAEGTHCVELRDATWATLYQVLAEVEAGTRPAPGSFADIEDELPALEWPV